MRGVGAEAVSGARSGLGPADAVGAGVDVWLAGVAEELELLVELLGGEYVRTAINDAVLELEAGGAGAV